MSQTRIWLLLLVFGILSLQFPGCVNRTGIVIAGPQTITLNTGVKITINDFSREEGEWIAEALATAPKKVQESIANISAKSPSWNEPAYCGESRTIYLGVYSRDAIREYVWHEVGHAYTMLISGKGIQASWERVAGRVYGAWAPDHFPSAGVLERHGARDYLEDIACWVKAVYACWNNERHPFDACYKSEPRYTMKLDLLWQYGFITTEQYNKVKSLIS